jgi:hypothetical protein
MIRTISIRGLRGFEDFELVDLGRVNLLVGNNNCGKTSILEAIQLYASNGNPLPVLQIAGRRGETHVETPERGGSYSRRLDVSHLFRGHDINADNEIEIAAETDGGRGQFKASIVESNYAVQENLFGEALSERGFDEVESGLALRLFWSTAETEIALSLSSEGSICGREIREYVSRVRSEGEQVKCVFTGGPAVEDVVEMFESVVLTREEELVTEALRTIEPTVERLATVSSDRATDRCAERGGIVVRCEGVEGRVPIGSMGDGMWRMLGLALALVSAENGILLVDEIDTGLHFTVMEEMWKLVHRASQRLGVQVFATTHSRDAYESLAGIARACEPGSREVTIQRIDLEKNRSIVFDEREIVAAAEHGTEVR